VSRISSHPTSAISPLATWRANAGGGSLRLMMTTPIPSGSALIASRITSSQSVPEASW
jgi:hypothetical protein